jgi:hypothetical protein
MTRLILFVLSACAALPIARSATAQEPSTRSKGSSTCIAIVLPRLQGVEGDATTIGGSVRELFASFLRGPSMEVVLLEARLPAHANEEAQQKQCPHVLTATVTSKRHTGGGLLGSVIGQAGSSAAWGIPMGGVGAAVARGATTAVTQAISEMASSTKARDELRLDFKLTSVDGRIELGPKSDKAKAAADGEDLLTPMVERASEAIAAVVKQ